MLLLILLSLQLVQHGPSVICALCSRSTSRGITLAQVTHNPPLVSISVATSAKGMKDTAHNIKATKNFTVNIISEPFIENANVSSIQPWLEALTTCSLAILP